MIGWFKKDRPPAPPRERGPLAVAIGGVIEVDVLSLHADVVGAEPGMKLPEGGNFIVAAYGEAKLDSATVLSRYYDDEHRLLQVMSGSGEPGAAITDVSLYQPWDSVVPVGAAEWDRWTGPDGLIGRRTYDADGILFDRFWGEGEDRAPLVEFVEDVDDGETVRSIHQTCMLYARRLGSAQEMLLINVERDLADRDNRQGSSIEFLLGYGLVPGDVRRI